MEIKGKLISKEETQTFSEKFSKRAFVIETQEKFPQQVQLEMVNDNCALLDGVNIDDLLTCELNIRGRKWTSPDGVDKYFNTLVCWKMSNEHAIKTDEVIENPFTGQKVTNKDDGLPF